MQDLHTVLIVDDDDTVLRLTAKMISKTGAKVLEASSGFEALDLFQTHRHQIDLVVSDVVMPGMFGDQLVKKLLALAPHLKFVLMSGNPLSSLETDLDLLEGQSFLQKPFAIEDLNEVLRAQLGPVLA